MAAAAALDFWLLNSTICDLQPEISHRRYYLRLLPIRMDEITNTRSNALNLKLICGLRLFCFCFVFVHIEAK